MMNLPGILPGRFFLDRIMLHVVLFQPEIPPNTGNVIRLCANTGAMLHLIEPLGFSLTDARVKRAGLDYHELACVRTHPNWKAFMAAGAVGRLFGFSTRARRSYAEAQFQDGDALVFGPETRGLPDSLLKEFGADRCLRLPMLPDSRSLNLSNTVAVTLYEAWKQLAFAGSVDTGQAN
jgi:tRNA (cytidine/uridine-2'-O-)-methyltransferase